MAAIFVANLAAHVTQESPCCGDPAINSVVAKNLARGAGYVSSYSHEMREPGEIVPFDPAISTGPTVLVPAALAIAWFGNEYWVPGGASAALSVGLVAGLFWCARRLFERPAEAAIAGMLLLISAHVASVYTFKVWHQPLGEADAALLVLIALAIVARRPLTGRAAAAAGIGLGLAILTKQVAALSAPAVAVGLLWACHDQAGSRSEAFRRAVPITAAAVAAALLPLVAFEAVKGVSLGAGGYADLKLRETVFFSNAGSGLAQLGAGGLDRVLAQASGNGRRLLDHLGGGASLVALFAAACLVLAAAFRGRRAQERFATLACLAFATHAVWWTALSFPGRIRHLLPGLLYWCAGLAAASARLSFSKLRIAALACGVAALAPLGSHYHAYLARMRFAAEPRTIAQMQLRDFLEQRRDRIVVADWWATGADLEYLLDGTANVIPVSLVPENRIAGALVVINGEWMNFAGDPDRDYERRMNGFIARCGAQPTFSAGTYTVYECAPE